MRAAVVRRFGGPEVIEIIETDAPAPGVGEIRVKVEAASVNQADVFVRAGLNVQGGATAERSQFGLGTDLAGTVDEVGPGVTRFRPGDRVIATQERLDLPLGPQAESVIVDEEAAAPAPADLSSAESTTLGLNGLTAYEALDALRLEPDRLLLVTGAAGAVGLFALELAVQRGIRVIAQARDSDEEFLRSRGATAFVSRDSDLLDRVRVLAPGGVDGCLDTANLGPAAADAVRHGGGYVNLLLGAPPARRQMTMTNLAWWSDGGRLRHLARLAEQRAVSTRVAHVLPLAEIQRAHRLLADGNLRGRIVLTP